MASARSTHSELIFAHNAPRLRQAGFAVLPADGKKPRRSGYRTWRSAPGLSVVSMWAEQDPGADIVYVPGLSRICSSDHGLVVLDGDDEDACARIVEVFGDTPGKVRTRRGCHNLYQATGVDLGKLTSLKKFGINADVKHGNSIVVAPPSRHQDDPGFAYAWDGCDETVIRDLPPFNRVALQKLVDSLNPSQLERIVHRQASSPRPLRDGSRKLGLNDRLVRIVWEVETETEMLKHALKINDEIGRADPRGPRTADQVMQVVQTVWRDRETGKIEKWSGVDGRQKRRRVELDLLTSIDPKGAPLAYVLLDVLRDLHSARCRGGETFALTVRSMARDQVIRGWGWRRYDRACKLLLRAGLIEQVSEFVDTADGRAAAQYKLSTCA